MDVAVTAINLSCTIGTFILSLLTYLKDRNMSK